MEDKENKKRCKWCGKLIDKNSNHEDICSFNDGGKEDMNYEMIKQIYFD